tara:strand:+ start:534 stop:692 length:159 start_codon:yes stop_codon:yes gene_type:complete
MGNRWSSDDDDDSLLPDRYKAVLKSIHDDRDKRPINEAGLKAAFKAISTTCD